MFFGHFCCKSPSLGQILDDDTEFQLISDLVVSIFSSYWIHDKINSRAEDNGSGLIQQSSDWTGLCLMYKETESMINTILLLCHLFQKIHNKRSAIIYVIQIHQTQYVSKQKHFKKGSNAHAATWHVIRKLNISEFNSKFGIVLTIDRACRNDKIPKVYSKKVLHKYFGYCVQWRWCKQDDM